MADTEQAMNDTRRWHASWIISAIIALLVALCASGTNLEMAPLITITVLGWLLATALIWVTTANDRHIKAKMVSSGALFILAGFAIYWIHTNDRPIMRPQIEVVQSKSLAGNRFALAIEALVKNSGRQGGYFENWNLSMSIDGIETQGKEMFDQEPPPNAVDKQTKFDEEEFPPGKHSRGWLFFSFTGMSHDVMMPYFTCNSDLMNKVVLKLSVWDSKTKHEWTDTKHLRDLGVESCTPPTLSIVGTPHASNQIPAAPKTKPVQPQTDKTPPNQSQNPPPTTPIVTAPVTTPGQSMNCEGSNCVLGNNFWQQLIVQNPGRGLNENQFLGLVAELRKLDHGTAALVMHQPIDGEMNRFGGQLQAAFQQAGWALTGYAIDISNNHIMVSNGPNQAMRNSPEGLHCVTDNSQLGNDLLKLLSEHGVHCSPSSSTLYPPPKPQPTLTIFMGRNLE